MTATPIELGRSLSAQLAEITGRSIRTPRTISGLHGSILRLPWTLLTEPQQRMLMHCNHHVRIATRAMDKGDEATAAHHMEEALSVAANYSKRNIRRP